MALACAGHSPCSSRLGRWRRRERSVEGRWLSGCAFPFFAGNQRGSSASHSANVSGRWNAKTRRLRGAGSIRFVKRVSKPVDWKRNGRGRR